MSSPRYTARVRIRTTFRRPVISTYGGPVLIDGSGKELKRDDQNKYIGTGTEKWEETKTETTLDPLMDDSGAPIEAGTPEALARKIREAFVEEENVEILGATILETRTVLEMDGNALKAIQ